MANLAEIFVDYLRDQNFSCDVKISETGDYFVNVPFDEISITLIFEGDDNGERVAFRSRLDRCPADRIPDMLITCNELNNAYRWVKFCIDDDNDIMIEDDAIVTEESVGLECLELIFRTVSIVREVKPKIMRVLYA